MFCGKCGAEIPEGAHFCPECGHEVSTEDVQSDETDSKAGEDQESDKTERIDAAEAAPDSTTAQTEPDEAGKPAADKPVPDEEKEETVTSEPSSSEATATIPQPEKEAEEQWSGSEEKRKNPFAAWVKANAKVVVGGIAAVIVLVAVLFGTHVLCFHDWQPATCTEPETCSICRRTQGKALGHKWEDATCTEPKTCTRCGETEGKALGHDVQEWTVTAAATCTAVGSRSGVCTRCGETQTEEIPMTDHTPSDWQIVKDVTISSSGSVTPGTKEIVCTVCGKVLQTEDYTIELTTSQSNALRKAASYLNYTSFSYSGLINQLEFEGYSTEDATFAADHCGADWNEQAVGKAKSYLSWTSFSRSGLINQLEFEGFTQDQAEYAADQVGL